MYKGEISIGQDELSTVLKAAESLQVRGLVDLDPKSDFRVGRYDDMEVRECSSDSPLLVAFDADDSEEPIKKKTLPELSNQSLKTKKRPFVEDKEESQKTLPTTKGGLVPRPQSALMEQRPTSPPVSPLLPPPPIPSPYSGMKSNSGSSSFGLHSMVSHPSPQIPPTSGLGGTKSGNGFTLDDLSDVKPGIMEMIQEEQRVIN